MALLLCMREAKNPYYSEKLDLRLWSMQELCYVIYNYPFLVRRDFATGQLVQFIREELSQGFLAAKLSKLLSDEEEDRTEEFLLLILTDCNYYTALEIEGYRKKLAELSRLPAYEAAAQEGVSLFRLRRYRMAESCFLRAVNELSAELRRLTEARERDALLRKKADVLCDIAVTRLRLFEEKEALSALSEAQRTASCERAAKLHYLLTGAEDADAPDGGFLSDEERASLSDRKEALSAEITASKDYREISRIFSQDAVKRKEQTEKLISGWKRAYRRML